MAARIIDCNSDERCVPKAERQAREDTYMVFIRYCEVCGRRVPKSEIESGDATLHDGGVCCAANKRLMSLCVNYLNSDPCDLPELRFGRFDSQDRLREYLNGIQTSESSGSRRRGTPSKSQTRVAKRQKTAAGIVGVSAVLIIVVLSLIAQTLMTAG